ncbi:MAG: Hpt domain-containing protein [Parcubacteria group bacterium]|nr:Hpt domain-containing protein [Parcubacteria group bacterium]
MSAEHAEKTAIDPGALANLRSLNVEGESDFASELIRIFLENAPGYIKAIGEGLAKRDLKAMSAAAHCLRSSSANLGAYQMRDFCARLEDLGLSGSFAGAEDLLKRLEADFKKVTQELKRELR